MIIVLAGFANGLAVDGTGDVADGGDCGLPVGVGLPIGVDSGTDAVPQPATSRHSTTASLLMRQV
jgi:hypothetical protein